MRYSRIRVAAVLAAGWFALPAAQMPDGLMRNPLIQLGPAASEDANAWLVAAAEHEPGKVDEAVRRIASWSPERLREALERVSEMKPHDLYNAALARGAMLHADISLLKQADGPDLTASGAITLFEDGRKIGTTTLDAQIGFARLVIDHMRPAAGDARVRLWYRATSADFAWRYWLADLMPHLEDARRLFPADSGILFDSGCLSETIASPRIQSAVPPPAPSKTFSPGTVIFEGNRLRMSRVYNLTQAERFYRQALTHDPSMTEARIRLAHVLSRQEKHKEAAEMVLTAGETPDPIVRYYAALVKGRLLQQVQRIDEARASFEQASALFPRAQSPYLALSALAREQGDAAAAAAAMAHVTRLPEYEAHRDDPWWQYLECNGRNFRGELQRLRYAFRTAGQK